MPETIDNRPYHHGNLPTAMLAAAERALREGGQARLTLRDLAKEVGVSHTAPRRHFGNLQGLLDALAETGFARLHAALSTALAAADHEFAARVRAAMAAYIGFATDNAALLELMYSSKHRPDATRIAAAAEAPFGLLNSVIVEGQQTGHLRAGPSERVGIVLFATMQGIAALVNGSFVAPELLDGLIDDAAEQFLQGNRPTRRTRRAEMLGATRAGRRESPRRSRRRPAGP